MSAGTLILKMDAYHDMVAEISVLKKKLEHCEATIVTLRDANKNYLVNYTNLAAANAALHHELRKARAQPRMFKTVRVG